MKHHNKISLILIGLALLVSVLFQNCSSVKFGGTSQSKSETDGTAQDEIKGEDTAEATPAPEMPDAELPNNPEIENAYANCDSLESNAPDFSSASGENVLLQAVEGNRSVESANDVRVVNYRGDLAIKKAKKVDLINFRGSAVVAASEVDVVDVRTLDTNDRLVIDADKMKSIQNTVIPICIRAASFESMVNLRSDEPIVLIGRSVNGVKPRIDSLTNLRGIVIIRNVDVDQVLNFRGSKLVLENSVVGRMQNVRTDIYIKNSLIGSELDIQGQRISY